MLGRFARSRRWVVGSRGSAPIPPGRLQDVLGHHDGGHGLGPSRIERQVGERLDGLVGGDPVAAGQGAQVGALRLIEVWRPAERFECGVGRVVEITALHPRVVLDTHAGELRNFGATRLRNPRGTVGPQADLFGFRLRSTCGQELPDLVTATHEPNARGMTAAEGCRVRTPLRARRARVRRGVLSVPPAVFCRVSCRTRFEPKGTMMRGSAAPGEHLRPAATSTRSAQHRSRRGSEDNDERCTVTTHDPRLGRARRQSPTGSRHPHPRAPLPLKVRSLRIRCPSTRGNSTLAASPPQRCSYRFRRVRHSRGEVPFAA